MCRVIKEGLGGAGEVMTHSAAGWGEAWGNLKVDKITFLCKLNLLLPSCVKVVVFI